MVNIDNITTASSGLSQLQKRILAYARRRMIEQGQEIEQPDEPGIKVCFAAPEWLQQALVTLTEKITVWRKRHILDGEYVGIDHPIINLINETAFVAEYLQGAAKAAG